jgi:Fe-S-cluster-containing dehydrogenase component
MIANYGYTDGSGTYLISIDTGKCDGCGKCVTACPYGVLEVVVNDFDPLKEGMMAAVVESHRNKIKYSCAPCKGSSGVSKPPCVHACPQEGAIIHSW